MSFKKKVVMPMVLLVALGLILTSPVVAQEETPEPPAVLQEESVDDLPGLELTADGISALVAFGLAWAIEYIPGFSGFWERFEYKRTAIAGFGLAAAFALLGLDYAGAVSIGIPKPFVWSGLISVLRAWLAFSGAAQLTYSAMAAKLPRKQVSVAGDAVRRVVS